MGRDPAEIAEGAEVYWKGEKGPTSEPFSTTALVCETVYFKMNRENRDQIGNLPTPPSQVENATASSAGDSLDPDGVVRSGKRPSFWTIADHTQKRMVDAVPPWVHALPCYAHK